MKINRFPLLFLISFFSLCVPSLFAQETAKTSTPLAKIGTTILTDDDLHKEMGMSVYEAENQLYQVKKNWIDQKAKALIFNQAAKETGMNLQAWQAKEIDAKMTPVAQQEIDQLAPRFGVQGSTKTPSDAEYKAMKDRAKQHLSQQRRTQRETELYQQMLQKYPIELFFTKPEAPIVNVIVLPDDPVRGPKDAPVTIIEFTEFQCPYCKRSQDTLHQIQQVYGNKVRLVEKQYPLPFHNRAKPAAEAAFCAKDQGKFWEMHDKLFSSQSMEDADIARFAGELGLNMNKFNKCLDEHKHAARIEIDAAEGQRVGVRGTPHFFINGKVINGAQPFEAFKMIIDEELAKKKS